MYKTLYGGRMSPVGRLKFWGGPYIFWKFFAPWCRERLLVCLTTWLFVRSANIIGINMLPFELFNGNLLTKIVCWLYRNLSTHYTCLAVAQAVSLRSVCPKAAVWPQTGPRRIYGGQIGSIVPSVIHTHVSVMSAVLTVW